MIVRVHFCPCFKTTRRLQARSQPRTEPRCRGCMAQAHRKDRDGARGPLPNRQSSRHAPSYAPPSPSSMVSRARNLRRFPSCLQSHRVIQPGATAPGVASQARSGQPARLRGGASVHRLGEGSKACSAFHGAEWHAEPPGELAVAEVVHTHQPQLCQSLTRTLRRGMARLCPIGSLTAYRWPQS
jgi:hypothetical protein